MSQTIEINDRDDLPCVYWNEVEDCPHANLKEEGEEVVCSKCGWNLFINTNLIPRSEINILGVWDDE